VFAEVHVPKQTIVPATKDSPAVEMFMMNMGSGIWPGEGEDAYEIMMTWFGQGGRSIDSAWLYRDQQNISRAMRDSGLQRKDVFITSKIPGCMGAKQAPSFIATDLQQFNTTYIDLMLIHWPGPKWIPGAPHYPPSAAVQNHSHPQWIPLRIPGDCAGTWQALEESYSKGESRAIGVSSFGVSHLEKLQKTWKVKPHVNQIEYNVFWRDENAIKWCDTNGIMIEAWSPLTAHWEKRPDDSVFKNPTVTSIAKAHNVSAAQVALKWIVQRNHSFAVLSGNKDHQADDAAIFENGLTLTSDEMNQLDSIKSSACINLARYPVFVFLLKMMSILIWGDTL